jgi:hypothetical protein
MTKQLTMPELNALRKALRSSAIPPVSFFDEHVKLDVSSDSGLAWKKSTAPQIKVGQRAGSKVNEYWVVCIEGVRYQVASVIMYIKTGIWPSEVIDHKNRNPSDNVSDDNLRYATYSDNALNSKMYINNTSGFKGVNAYETQGGTRYQWRLIVGKTGYSKAGFLTLEDAARARDRALLEMAPHLGADCGLNFDYRDYQ